MVSEFLKPKKIEDVIHRIMVQTLVDYDGSFSNKSKNKLAKIIAEKLSDDDKKIAVQKYCQSIIDDAIENNIISKSKVLNYKYVYELNNYNN